MSKPLSKIQHAFAKAKDRTRAMAQSQGLRNAFATAAAGGTVVTFFGATIASAVVAVGALPLVPGVAAAVLLGMAGGTTAKYAARAVYNRFKK